MAAFHHVLKSRSSRWTDAVRKAYRQPPLGSDNHRKDSRRMPMATRSSTVRQQNVQSKITMIFILVLSLSGLENLIAELLPEFEIGLIEVGISTFWFVPLSLCLIFNNWWAALAAPLGEIVFSDLVLGEFGGLGEFEEVLLVTVALFAAGRLIKDVRNRRQLLIIALLSYVFAELPATFIDIFKVWVGVEGLEAVAGLPESIVILEGIDFLVEYVISGIIFGAIPTLWLVPRLHGTIEPLIGLKPREPGERAALDGSGLGIYAAIGFVLATLIAVVSEMGFNIIEWEPEFLDSIGEWFIWIPIALAAIVAAIVLIVRRNRREAS
jgi:hypothetical protein